MLIELWFLYLCRWLYCFSSCFKIIIRDEIQKTKTHFRNQHSILFEFLFGDDWPWLLKNVGARHHFLPYRASLSNNKAKACAQGTDAKQLTHLLHNIYIQMQITLN